MCKSMSVRQKERTPRQGEPRQSESMRKRQTDILTDPETEAHTEMCQKQTHRASREGLEVWKRATEAGRACKRDLVCVYWGGRGPPWK